MVGQMRSWAAAHPRSRGENMLTYDPQISRPGSSPLTRGKRDVGGVRAGGGGLIPAHAGKTHAAIEWVAQSEAHPRSRGENVQVTGAALDPKGSSPLTRGKRFVALVGGGVVGLIPAHAGKTSQHDWASS